MLHDVAVSAPVTSSIALARYRKEKECSCGESKCLHVCPPLLLTETSIIGSTEPLPPPAATEEADEELLSQEPWIRSPIYMDYGTNVEVGQGAFINWNCTIVDTCRVSIGARTLFGPNVSLYSGFHLLDPVVRNGTAGAEAGKEIIIEEDVWIGGNVVVLPGVRIGRGSVIGAGSVVTKSVPPLWVAVGNPARLLREIKSSMVVETGSNTMRAPPAADMEPVTQIQTTLNAGYHDKDEIP
jgi:hypothetical protein